MNRKSRSPPSKRVKLEPSSPPNFPVPNAVGNDSEHEDPEFQCSICLQDIVDRTVVPACFHEFCFECLIVWSEQSRRCPLCSRPLGDYLLHNIRSKYDFRRYHLAPLRTSPVPVERRANVEHGRRHRNTRERERERRLREEREATDKLTRSIEKRRWIYHQHLYAKHVASNSYTRYRPYPTPAQFSASNDLISKTTMFLRRELQVWDDLDVEFLTTFTISMMKSIDIRSESAVKLLAEFLDMDVPYVAGGRHVNAEHFAHEVYSFVRSPFRDLFVYDSVVQYDLVNETAPPEQRDRRWLSIDRPRFRSRSRSRSRSPSPSSDTRSSGGRERSLSWSPSGRRHLSTRNVSPNMEGSRGRRGKERSKDREFSDTRDNGHNTADKARGTSRCPNENVKEKERATFPSETIGTPIAAVGSVDRSTEEARSVAQPSIEAPTSLPRSSMARLPRSGHRSLVQSVQKHLTQGHGQSGVSKGKAIERHRDATSSAHDSTFSTPLLSRFSDGPTAAQRPRGGPELDSLTSSLNAACSHHDPPDDSNAQPSRPTRVFPSETVAQTRPLKPQIVTDVQPIYNSLSLSAPPADDDAHTPQLLAPLPTFDFTETLGAAKDELGNLPISPPTTSSLRGCFTNTPLSQSQTIPISSLPDDLFHHEASSGTLHLGASSSSNPIDDSRLPMSTSNTNCSKSHNSSDSRTKLLSRLVWERLHVNSAESQEPLKRLKDHRSQVADSKQSTILPGPVQAPDTEAVDPHAMEVKLRTRAQLHVRLAAEKRRSGV